MAYPNITPINIGKDGWGPTYSTEVDRLLYHCGLRYNSKQTTKSWSIAKKVNLDSTKEETK
jgi:hypothetical protein